MRVAAKKIDGGAPTRFQFRPRGFVLVYRPGEKCRCPSCGRSSWNVGRTTAECSFCETALPIVSDGAPDLRTFEQ